MTKANIRTQVARNLRLLSSDEATIISDSNVTTDGLDIAIDQIYRDEVAQILMDKYPSDFERTTFPLNTYTSTLVVTTVVGTTLTAPEGTFSNFDEGFTIQNPTHNEFIKIATYTSDTEVELATEPVNTWDGDTVYVLGNEFFFEGDAVDLRENTLVGIKYKSTDNDYIYATLRRKHEIVPLNSEYFSTSSPVMYLTSITKEDLSTGITTFLRGVGILPYPEYYNGKVQITYIQRPPELEDTEEPIPYVSGISEAIIRGVTAWGARVLQDYALADRFDALYKEQLSTIINSYKPRSRGKPSMLRLAPHYRRISNNTTI